MLRGKPLYLNEERYAALTHMVMAILLAVISYLMLLNDDSGNLNQTVSQVTIPNNFDVDFKICTCPYDCLFCVCMALLFVHVLTLFVILNCRWLHMALTRVLKCCARPPLTLSQFRGSYNLFYCKGQV